VAPSEYKIDQLDELTETAQCELWWGDASRSCQVHLVWCVDDRVDTWSRHPSAD